MTSTDGPSFALIESAQAILDGHARCTPVMSSRLLDQRCGTQVLLKCENFQRVGAFKFRGAFTAVSRLTTAQRTAGVVAFSSGNHAQAVALAAALHDCPATIVMPYDAPAAKLAAAQAYGAHVVEYDRYTEDRGAIAAEIAQSQGAALIPPYDHPDVISGQGTVAAEFVRHAEHLDVLLVPLGGGGLLSGSLLAMQELSPSTRVYGVEPSAGDDGLQSLRAGKRVHIDPPRTVADGAATTALGEHTFEIIARNVTDILTVDDESLLSAMSYVASRLKIVIEPTAALGVAAAIDHSNLWPNARVGVIVTGGNVELSTLG